MTGFEKKNTELIGHKLYFHEKRRFSATWMAAHLRSGYYRMELCNHDAYFRIPKEGS